MIKVISSKSEQLCTNFCIFSFDIRYPKPSRGNAYL